MTSRPSVPPVQEHKATIAVSLFLLFLLLASSPCFAEGKSERREGKSDEKSAQLTVPMAGTFAGLGKFSGTLTVQRFIADNGQVKAVGMVSGTLFDATGLPLGTVLQGPLLVPVTDSAASTSIQTIQPPDTYDHAMRLKAS